MPHPRKEQEHATRFNGQVDFARGFKISPPTGNINEGKTVKHPALLPVKGIAFGVAGRRIGGMRWDARFANGGHKKPPFAVPVTDGKISMKGKIIAFHGPARLLGHYR